MTELKEIIRDIEAELECAEGYAKEAVKHKHEYPELASVYAQIAKDDMGHADALHKQALAMIEEKKREGAEAPASMKAIWEYEHERQIEDAANVRRLLDMYNM